MVLNSASPLGKLELNNGLACILDVTPAPASAPSPAPDPEPEPEPDIDSDEDPDTDVIPIPALNDADCTKSRCFPSPFFFSHMSSSHSLSRSSFHRSSSTACCVLSSWRSDKVREKGGARGALESERVISSRGSIRVSTGDRDDPVVLVLSIAVRE